MDATVFVGTSLDGFIAREDGAIDWLTSAEASGEDEDFGFGAFLETVDILVMGRNTYEVVRQFAEWPYGSTPVVVLTSRPLEGSREPTAQVEALSGTPREIVHRLAERGAKHLYVDGGKTIQSFLREGLIQRLIVTRVPILIGSGIPLFGPVPGDIHLRHIDTRVYRSGLVQSEYEVLP